MTRCLVITGPTASGKTRLAVHLARLFNGEIISADSRQVYRGLDIGTGKDLDEYADGGAPVPYHLIDVADPSEDFHLFRYLKLAQDALADITGRHRLPILCGGTPLYIKALLDGYDQDGGAPDPDLRRELDQKPLEELVAMLKAEAPAPLFARTDLTQKRRVVRSLELARYGHAVPPVPPIDDALIIAPFYDRSVIHQRVQIRLDQRLEAGMVDEVRGLHDQGLSWEKMDWMGLEYRYVSKYLTGELDWKQMHDTLLAHIRQFCKHQDGWFRHYERDGKTIYWIPDGNPQQAAGLVDDWLAGRPLPPVTIRLSDITYGKSCQSAMTCARAHEDFTDSGSTESEKQTLEPSRFGSKTFNGTYTAT